MPSTKDKQWDYGIRAGVLTLWDWGGMTTKEICEKYGMPRRTFNAIHNKALARGWGPGQPVLIAHVEDGARSGRPKTRGDGSDRPLEGADSIDPPASYLPGDT
ncbi:glycosyl transferase family 25 [Colletotrichum scovillei]|uniref:Glycosyl transferase family 25 n=1 Tax=Colletotrichum scovillei TaxID=1209932 RepID=A0A9P7UFK0_9PEZI|nr:glycosyl transferase family 25 [Colletotrichum scovillei]KAG7074290.1 glycosyl transferase family 25 [Colletotrichum scovillei]KAG7081576.1 glycosyl transferase family 25 [Colletotrichum scovillei]